MEYLKDRDLFEQQGAGLNLLIANSGIVAAYVAAVANAVPPAEPKKPQIVSVEKAAPTPAV